MAHSGRHNPHQVRAEGRTRPDPPGTPAWRGGDEDFETLWTLKGHKLPPAGYVDPWEAAKISRNHNRLDETEGFCD
jgi:hypothetical protein